MKILIVDDSENWVLFHKTAIQEIFDNKITIDTANSASQGVDKITASIDEPYNYILTDLNMEFNYAPLLAGEWFIKQIQFFKEYKDTKIIIISAEENIKRISEKYNVDYIPKYRCNNINEYCNKILKK